MRLVASPDGGDGSLSIRHDERLYLATLDGGEHVMHELSHGRHAWLQVLRGAVGLNGRRLAAGAGAAVAEESSLTIAADGPAEVLLFDLA